MKGGKPMRMGTTVVSVVVAFDLIIVSSAVGLED